MKVIVDSREKTPYNFSSVDSETRYLETGDYSVEGFEDVFAVERKSLNDLTRSLGADRKRFEAEIKRAQSFQQFVVVIEASRQQISAGDYYSGMHPNAIHGTVDGPNSWPTKYSTMEFEYCGNRELAEARTLSLLKKWYEQYATTLW